jgi:hypothetical protein
MDSGCGKLAPKVNEHAMKLFVIEIKLHINQKLYQRGVLTEEMFTRAKELILKDYAA